MKKQKLIIIALLTIILTAIAMYFINAPSDRCTSKDRRQNNCVPAGRCTPLGDPLEEVTDCRIKDYDHKYKQ